MEVKFDGASDDQANFGGGKDPRDYLEVGETYEVIKTDVHDWHTLYYINIPIGKSIPFNSVCFTAIEASIGKKK